jgi:hypothetical protein
MMLVVKKSKHGVGDTMEKDNQYSATITEELNEDFFLPQPFTPKFPEKSPLLPKSPTFPGLPPSLEPQTILPEELLTTSYAIIGKKKSSKSSKEAILRRKKTFVEKVFIELVKKFPEEEMQKLNWLEFYQDLSVGMQNSSAPLQQQQVQKPISPYFVSEKTLCSNSVKVRHASLKARFQKMAHKKVVALCAQDHFQLACTLAKLWEVAVRIVEHQDHLGTTLFELAEKMVASAKNLPLAYSPIDEEKTLVHISSFKMSTKGGSKKLKVEQQNTIYEFAKNSLLFGYEYFGIAEP